LTSCSRPIRPSRADPPAATAGRVSPVTQETECAACTLRHEHLGARLGQRGLRDRALGDGLPLVQDAGEVPEWHGPLAPRPAAPGDGRPRRPTVEENLERVALGAGVVVLPAGFYQPRWRRRS
jgi:hypothetical protein